MYGYAFASERVADSITHKEPVLTYAGAKTAAEFAYFDGSKAQKELGLAFRPLEETIRDAIAWFRQIGMIK